MSAHVLLNLLNELRKSDKIGDLPSILSLFFCNNFNKFNNTEARMLDSIYQMTLRFLWNLISAIKALQISHYVLSVGRHNLSRKSLDFIVWHCFIPRLDVI